ncbi:hypothetical protein EJ08DRAFT_697996 [Tothia fuscella]|uniref:Mitochondrial distribution and morphology protein 10 n=1 Tax=Tothia fuscella TaxID=1048955 RepID=A0A9P4TWW7_9PEZI|nr:hypothetical protein EJ08DRAFT_697996 [Tothia fuscella]
MLTFMDYIQTAFHTSSQWNQDNSYSFLTSTAQSLLDFEIPRGLRLHVSSLPSPNLASSYTLSTTGLLDGSISYLYSSLPLSIPSASTSLDLHDFIRGYRHLVPPRAPEEAWWWEVWHRGKRVDRRDVLLYGRIFLPRNSLEALYLRRLTPTRVLKISAVSDAAFPNGASVLGVVQNDHGKFSTEYLYSSDSALLGVRGLYNFGPDPRERLSTPPSIPPSPISSLLPHSDPNPPTTPPGLFSAGAELYYGILNKSGGISTGLRFTTLPSHTSFPYTMTLTLNPLMGNLSSTYAVKAGRHLALCSRFDFNFYSYESGVLVGCELWRMNKYSKEVEWARKRMLDASSVSSGQKVGMSGVVGGEIPSPLDVAKRRLDDEDEDVTGVLKARVDQNWRFGLLWEGRFKEVLFSVGASLDLGKREQIFGGFGVEVQYSS